MRTICRLLGSRAGTYVSDAKAINLRVALIEVIGLSGAAGQVNQYASVRLGESRDRILVGGSECLLEGSPGGLLEIILTKSDTKGGAESRVHGQDVWGGWGTARGEMCVREALKGKCVRLELCDIDGRPAGAVLLTVCTDVRVEGEDALQLPYEEIEDSMWEAYGYEAAQKAVLSALMCLGDARRNGDADDLSFEALRCIRLAAGAFGGKNSEVSDVWRLVRVP